MSEDLSRVGETISTRDVEPQQNEEEERDPESNSLHQPLLKTNRTLSSIPFAMVGTKVSHIESLDYEINENELFKHDWRSRSKTQVLQYIFLKWTLAFLVGLLTGLIATLINLAVENIAGYKLLAVVGMVAAVLCVCFAPAAAGPGIPEIKAYLNGVDTPNMFGATTLVVKVGSFWHSDANSILQVSPVVGILTRQDLRAQNILNAFPHLAQPMGREKSN